MTYNILIVDNSEQYLSELKIILNKKLMSCNIYTAKDFFELILLAKKYKIHVLLFDANILIDEDLDAQYIAHKLLIDTKLIALFNNENLIHLKYFISKGVDGYMVKNKCAEQVSKAIEAALVNMCCFEQKLLVHFLEETHATMLDETKKLTAIKLDEKETKIMKLLLLEYTNDEIANKLFMGKKTFENLLHELCLKFNVKTKVGLAVAAGKLALLKRFS